jgi:cellobiose phosphorylase
MANFGRFSEDGREYIIEAPLGPVRHLVNFSWNDKVISGVNQFGTGEGVFNNQTLLYNDPAGRARMVRDGRRYFYVRDDDSSAYWNIGYFPVKHEPLKLTTVVGVKYTKFLHEAEKIRTEALCFVDSHEPVEIWRITFENLDDHPRQLRVYPYVEWMLQGYPATSDYISYLKSEYHSEINTITGNNISDERPHRRYTGFLAADVQASGFTGSAREFMGTYGEPTRPEVVRLGKCSNRATSNEILAGSLEIPARLETGGRFQVTFLIGNTSDEFEETQRIVKQMFAVGYIDGVFAQLVRQSQETAEHTVIATPDKSLDRMVNIWAKNQVQLCAEFGRDGVRGFRDTLQDAWGIVSFEPGLARSKILEALRYQLQAGWTLRGWMPVNPRHYSDGPTWIAPAVAEYIKYTGDRKILDEVVPYYDAGEATVLGHLLQGLRHLHAERGAHGLCLAHRGDWNDSLDWMGQAGRGESVMTSMGFYHSLNIVEAMARELLSDTVLAEEMRACAEDIQKAVELNAWDGAWYLQGYSDFGNPVGSHTNAQGQIYLPPQAWAVYSGIGSTERLAMCTRSALERLESEHGCLVSCPAYTHADENVGRLTVILPGTYENASPYCHGTAFMIAALLKAGRPDDALRLYRKVMPDNADHPSDRSGVEPYAFTNQVLGPDNLRRGVSVSGWITGTAGWMYNNVVKLFFGLQPDYTGVHIRPCLPQEWKSVSMVTHLRNTQYNVKINNLRGVNKELVVNGREIEGDFVPYSNEALVNVEVWLK